MNLKDKKMKFDVSGNPELSEAIQIRLFSLGCLCNGSRDAIVRYKNMRFLYVENGFLIYGMDEDQFCVSSCKKSSLKDLYTKTFVLTTACRVMLTSVFQKIKSLVQS